MPKKLLAIGSLVLFVTFILFSYFTAKEIFQNFDFDSMVKLQDHLPRILDYPFSLISVIGSAEITALIWLIFLGYTLIKRLFLMSCSLILFPLSALIELFGKTVLLHPAPPHFFYRGVIKFDFPSQYIQTDFSYPSGHVTRLTFLLVLLLLFLSYKLPLRYHLVTQWGIVALLALVCISRVYLGEHWSTDVIGGLLLGGSFGLLAGLTIPNRKTINTE